MRKNKVVIYQTAQQNWYFMQHLQENITIIHLLLWSFRIPYNIKKKHLGDHE